jgi:hypothetical protein
LPSNLLVYIPIFSNPQRRKNKYLLSLNGADHQSVALEKSHFSKDFTGYDCRYFNTMAITGCCIGMVDNAGRRFIALLRCMVASAFQAL